MEWGRSGSDSGAEAAAAKDDGAIADDSDLREHVVGILFAGHKLTSLQKQVGYANPVVYQDIVLHVITVAPLILNSSRFC